MDTITFDLETRKLATDLPNGWDDLRRGEGGISCVVAWSSSSGRPHIFDQEGLPALADMLEATDCILSFNGVGFDLPIIESLLGRKLAIHRHLDLLQLVWEANGDRKQRHGGYRLTECAQRALGIGKSGDGAMAPQLADEGKWASLHDYCIQDVHITRKLFQFAQKNGGIIGTDGELKRLPFPEWFGDLQI